MRYWWVSHSSSFKKEVGGGYIWCPQVHEGDTQRVSWINVSLVKPGDWIFSYANQKIRAIGIALTEAVDAEPPEGYSAGGWGRLGWRVDVNWLELDQPYAPKQHIDVIRPLLPAQHAPIRADGDGNIVYLVGISSALAELLAEIGSVSDPRLQHDLDHAQVDATAPDRTTRSALIQARVGQGVFRKRVAEVEPRCRLTGTADPTLLIASHIKPWSESDNDERLSGANGLLLAPHVDKLFDRGRISFSDSGQVLVKDADTSIALKEWGLDRVSNVGHFSRDQAHFLAFHRQHWGYADDT